MTKVLIADDDALLRNMYSLHLKREGYDVLIATDGQDAVKKTLRFQPDILLLDLRMPKIDGIEVMKRIRYMESCKELPIIILTNLDLTDEILSEVVNEQPSYYLLKVNSSPKIIVEKINEILQINTTNGKTTDR